MCGGQHARALGDAGFDCVPQSDVDEILGAYVAHGGEAGLQRTARIERGVVSLLGRKAHDVVVEAAVVVLLQLQRQVHVGIDETGEDCCISQVDHARPRRWGRVSNGNDPIASDNNGRSAA